MPTISVQKNNGATYIGTLPKLKRDYLIEAGTKGVFDFGTPYTNDGGTLAVNKDFKNLVAGGGSAVVKSISGLSQVAGGVKSLNGNGWILLPDEFRLASNTANFMAIVWVKKVSGQPEIYGYGNYSSPSVIQYNMNYFNTSTGLQLQADAKTAFVSGIVGAVTQHAVEYVANGVNSKIIAYTNGVKVSEALFDNSDSLNIPTAVCDPRLFAMGTTAGVVSTNNSTSELTIYRVMLDDLTLSGRTGASLALADYDRNKNRFV